METENILAAAKRIIDIESNTLISVSKNLDSSFAKAVDVLCRCKGKIVITGMGKSGIIGKKICGTLASIGSPSIFLHPGEAVHGDLGMVSEKDVVLVLSNSGGTEEILRILPSLRKIGATIISITSSKDSALSIQSDIVIATGEIEEADDFKLIPSSSTTCQLVLGDALALTMLTLGGLQKEEFAFYHPAGNLGKRLMLKVKDVMQTGTNVPIITENMSMQGVIEEINRKNLGFALIVDDNGSLTGIVTDGDLRRALAKHPDIREISLCECITGNPRTIEEDKLAVQAMGLMEKYEITCLVILDDKDKPKGVVHLHDLLGKKEFGIEI